MSWLITGLGMSPGPLDIAGSSAAAYSLRNLSANYSGNVVRVRRSSDSTEQDFTAPQVTNGALTTFCGAGNGFVRTWYDQSGNNAHLINATSAEQPLIVSSGSLLLLGGKPTLLFDGSDDTLSKTGGANWQTAFVVCNYTESSSIFTNFDGLLTSTDSLGPSQGIGIIGQSSGNAFFTGTTWFDLFYFNAALAGAVFPAINSISLITAISTDAVSGLSGLRLGQDRGSTGRFWGGSISEVIIMNSDQSNTRLAVSANINAHYAIY